MRRMALCFFFGCYAMFCLSQRPLFADETSEPRNVRHPNLVFVFADQLRRQAIGCMGGDPVVTPNLDRFAEESCVFTRAVSSYPVCSPMRAMLMTGKYPFNNGVHANCNSQTRPHGVYLRSAEGTFSQVLGEAGYECGYLGKWHLDSPEGENAARARGDGKVWDGFVPPEHRHGFNFWYAYNCRDEHLNPRYWTTDATGFDDHILPREWSVKHETDVAIDYLRNEGGQMRDPAKPFAVFLSFNPPHTPFKAVPEEYVAMYDDRTIGELLNRANVDITRDTPNTRKAVANVKHYFAAVTGIDAHFGRLMQCLDEEGLAEETIVVFTSDHGEMMGSQDRMHKGVWFAESMGVPLIVRYPGVIAPKRDDLLIGTPDLMPTFLSLMGLSSRIPDDVEGSDYAAILRGEPQQRPDSAFYVVTPVDDKARGARGLETARYTFCIQRKAGGDTVLLYDNEADPYQRRSVAETRPEVVERLTERLRRWMDKTGDPWERPR